MLTKEVVKDYALRKCLHLAYLQTEEKGLLSFWEHLVREKKDPNDYFSEDDKDEVNFSLPPFEYFKTNPKVLEKAKKLYRERMGEDVVTNFIAENQDFQEVSVLSRRYFSLHAKNSKRADTVDGSLDGPEIFDQAYIERNTQEYLKDESVDVIFEGQFTIDGLRARFDILERNEDGSFNLYEVKGTNGVYGSSERSLKLGYLYDMAFQYEVYKRSGLKLNKLSFIHLNKLFTLSTLSYPLDDKDLELLFTYTDDIVVGPQKEPSRIPLKAYYDQLLYVTDVKMDVNIYIDDLLANKTLLDSVCKYRCRKEGGCPLIKVCFPDVDSDHMLRLTCNNRAGGNYSDSTTIIDEDRVLKIKDINAAYVELKYPRVKRRDKGKGPEYRSMARMQIDFCKGELTRKHVIEYEKLEELLEKEYSVFPLIFFDFESFNYPIPLVKDAHPWDQICCQYSMHIVEKGYDLSKHDFDKGVGGGITHYEYIGHPKDDGYESPDYKLILTLKDQLEKANVNWQEGKFTVVVYNDNFEKGRLQYMAEKYQDYHDFLMLFRDRVVDLYKPFYDGLWYYQDFHGSLSLKTTQPMLIGDGKIQGWYKDLPYDINHTLDYHTGIIHNGQVALDVYQTLLRKTHKDGDPGELYEKLIESLLHYCKIDSWGTVILYDIMIKALEKIKNGTIDIDIDLSNHIL